MAPLAPTCGDRVIDFFVVSKSLCHAAEVFCTIADEGFEPHNPVRLFIESDARHAMVRNLKVPGGFNAELPLGPANEVKEMEDGPRTLMPGDSTVPGIAVAGKGSNYIGLVRQIEKGAVCG